jgi:glycosyltransferase involved in cell wall biosynthesis
MRRRVLWVSDSPVLNTGHAKVGRELLPRLNRVAAVACAGWFHPYEEPDDDLGFRIYPAGPDFGRNSLPAIIEDFGPDVVIGLGDFWAFEWWKADGITQGAPTILYLPIDGRLAHPQFRRVLCDAARVVSPSKFGEEVITYAAPEAAVMTIPFGADPSVLAPAADRAKVRTSTYLPVVSSSRIHVSLQDKFVVGCVARNQPRKQLPLLIEAFARFSQGKQDAMLYLHTSPRDSGWDLPPLLAQHGAAHKTVVPDGISVYRGLKDDELSRVYNCFDVFALPTMGEGFGLPLLEAMACGVPVIATDCSAVTELVKGQGELIRVKQWLTQGHFNVQHALADSAHLSELLERLYTSATRRTHCSRRGRRFAATLTWDQCAESWLKLLEGYECGRRGRLRRIVDPAAHEAATALGRLAEAVGQTALTRLGKANASAGLRVAAEVAAHEAAVSVLPDRQRLVRDEAIGGLEQALAVLQDAEQLTNLTERHREAVVSVLSWLDADGRAVAERFALRRLLPFWTPPVPSSITVSAPFMVYDGYGSMAQYLVLGMARAGAKVNVAPIHLELAGTMPGFEKIVESSKPEEGAPVLYFCWPLPHLQPYLAAENLFINTMWESSALPRDWPEQLNRARAVIVPTRFVARVCRESGVTVPIEVIPEGIDPHVYRYVERPERAGLTTLMVGTMVDRKHTREGIAAWKRAFADDPEARLIIKARFNYKNYTPDDPRIRFVDADEPTRGIAHWYAEADVLLALGNEGFGLPLVEAMATGLPVIALNSEGQADVCQDAKGLVLPIEPAGWQTAYQKEFGRCGVRGVPGVDEVARKLRWVAAHREEAREMGRAASEWARRERNVWKKGPAVLDLMERHVEPSRSLRRAATFWTPSWGKPCGIAEYTASLAAELPAARVVKEAPDLRGVRVLHLQHEGSLFDDAELTRRVREARRAEVPVAITEHTVWPGGHPWERDASALIACTERGTDMLRARWADKVIEHIPIGCPTWFPPRKVSRGRVIGAFGFLEWYKGFWRLLEILREVPDTELLLFSHAKWPQNEAAWEEAARGLPVRRVGEFLPEEEIARRLAAEADILAFWYDDCVHASASAAVCLGLATGVPVLASPVSWFHDQRHVTFQPRDLTEGVRQLLDDTVLRDQLTEAARDYCHQHNWRRTAKRHEALWQRLLSA